MEKVAAVSDFGENSTYIPLAVAQIITEARQIETDICVMGDDGLTFV